MIKALCKVSEDSSLVVEDSSRKVLTKYIDPDEGLIYVQVEQVRL